MSELVYINYKDVIIEANKGNCTKNLTNFYKHKEFINTFQIVFGFDDKVILEKMLKKWNNVIRADVKNCEKNNLIILREKYEIKRLSLRELTKIINIGKYTKHILKFSPEWGLAFTLGIFYANFIFEQTSIDLSIDKIYSIIPSNLQSTNEYKKFQKRFFIDGTHRDLLNILFSFEN